MLTLQIDHQDGSTSELEALQLREIEDFDEQSRAEATVLRSDWQAVEDDLDERNDHLSTHEDGSPRFGGRFDDVETDGSTASVRIKSYESDAAESEPTGGNLTYQNVADSEIASDAIEAAYGVEAGTIETLAPTISYSTSSGSRAKILRDLRKATGAELRYDGTTDPPTANYLERRGSDRTDEVTLSPDESNISNVQKTIDYVEEVTHLLVLGAQSGPDQRRGAVVPDTDPADYEGSDRYDSVVRYEGSSWSSGEKPAWTDYSEKEALDLDQLETTGETLIEEYQDEPRSLSVSCWVYDEALELGDSVTVHYPEEGIVDAELRVVKHTTIRGNGGGDDDGPRQEVTLSNRSLTRRKNNAEKDRDDLQKFNAGYEGYVDRDQVTSGWDVAGDGESQELIIPNWPDDIVTEQSVELTVLGRAWRSPVSVEPHDHTVTIPNHDHSVTISSHDHTVTIPDHEHTVTIPSHTHSFDWEHSHSVTIPDHDHAISFSIDDHTHDVTIPNHSHGLTYYAAPHEHGINLLNEEETSDPNPEGVVGSHTHTYSIPRDLTQGMYGLEAETETTDDGGGTSETTDGGGSKVVETTSDDGGGTTETTEGGGNADDTTESGGGTTETTSDGGGTTTTTNNGGGTTTTTNDGGGTTETTSSTTPLSAEVTTEFDSTQYYPEEVSITVNGTEVAVLSGDSSQWTETIDIRGELTAGQNTIAAEPGTRGELNLVLSSELFRRGRTHQ